MGAQTQFRYAPNGMPSGLDYAGVRAYMASVRRTAKYTEDDFVGMQVVETNFLEGLQEKHAKDGESDDTH